MMNKKTYESCGEEIDINATNCWNNTFENCYRSDWINVKDRLPELNTKVLITSGDNIYAGWICFKSTEGEISWAYSECCGWDAGDITHWQPLPEPPKKEPTPCQR